MCYQKYTFIKFGFSFSIKIGYKKEISISFENEVGAIPRKQISEREVGKYDIYRRFLKAGGTEKRSE